MKMLQLIAAAATLSQTTAVGVNVQDWESGLDRKTITDLAKIIVPGDSSTARKRGILGNLANCIAGVGSRDEDCEDAVVLFLHLQRQYTLANPSEERTEQEFRDLACEAQAEILDPTDCKIKHIKRQIETLEEEM